MKIMIAYDGSRNARLALAQTITMFRDLKPVITLVAVAENPRDITSGNEDMFQEEVADLKKHIAEALEGAELGMEFIDLGHCGHLARDFLVEHLPQGLADGTDTEIELLKSVFYRNKGAYLVGRIHHDGEQVPLVLPVLHGEGFGEQQGGDPSLHLDTVLIETDEVSIIFSFTRAYFQVEVAVPREFVDYLQQYL